MHQAKLVNDIDYAGEMCLLESSIERAQVQLSLTVEPAASLGLLINTSKIEYMTLNCPWNQKLKVRSEALNKGKRLPLTTIHVVSTTSNVRRLLLALHSGASTNSGIHRQYLWTCLEVVFSFYCMTAKRG